MTRPSRAVAPSARVRAALAIAAVVGAQALLVAPVAAGPAPGSVESDALALAALPASVQAVPPAAGPSPANDAGVLPSVHYEEAIDHLDDRIEFKPGAVVDVPFQPRAGDRWAVGGVAPRALPAGRVSGKAMAAAPQGSRWTASGTDADSGAPVGASEAAPTPDPSVPPPVDASVDAPVDAPAVDPASLQPAAGALAAAPTVEAQGAPQASGLFRQVFGFLPYWELSDSSTVLDYSVLSTIAYFSVGTDSAGNLLKKNPDGSTTTGWGGWTSTRLTNVINAAHTRGTRVVLTVTSFAWTTAEATKQKTLLGSATARLNLARQAAAAVRDRGADGINLDFEPIASGYADEFTALVRTVRAELDRIAPGYQLTFDTTGFIGNYPIEAATAPGGADAIFIMGYDYKTAGAAKAGSIAPLTGPSYDISDTVAAYLARVPASKLILGVPYYGRAWSTDTDQVGAQNISGTQYGASTTVVYKTAIEYAAQHGRRWDSTEQSPYVVYRRENCTTAYGCVTPWRQLWYDDATSLKAKYDLVNRYGLRGAGIWALGYDDGRSELNAALAEKFLHDTTPPLAGIRLLGWRQRDAGFAVSWVGSDASGIGSWDVQVSVDGGAFTPWLTGTTKSSEIYLGESGHGYAFRVRAKDLKGNVGSWDVASTWSAAPTLAVGGFGGVKVDGLTMRATPSTTGTKVGELQAGQIVSIVGGPTTANGYRWWKAVGPIRDWQAVSAVDTFWVAQGPSTDPYLVASRAPNSTVVDAVIRDLSVGDSLAAAGDARTFSPNGDGRRDSIALRWRNAVALDSLVLKVYRADGSLVGSVALANRAAGEQAYAWNGVVGGSRVPDGTYLLALSGVDAGTTYSAPSSQPVTPAQVAAYGVTVDTVAPPITGASLSGTAFSPNGDGVSDVVSTTLSGTGVTGWGTSVARLTGSTPGAAIRTEAGAGSRGAWSWDGAEDAGSAAPDGSYRITMWIADAAGNRSARTWDVALDRRAPAVLASGTPAAFSPNGDGVADTVRLAWSVDETAAGKARILKGTTVLKTWAAGPTGAVTWNGLASDGRAAADGTYTLRVDVVDAAGNRTVRDARIIVDRTLGRVGWSPSAFFPHDGDALAKSSTISFYLTRQAVTSLRIYGVDGTYIRTPWANRTLAAGTHRWTWNGRTAAGALVPRGVYKVVATAKSSIGTTTIVKWVHVNAYVVGLSSPTPGAGETLTVTIRAAEAMAAAPKVTFAQAGRTPVTKTAVSTGSGRYSVTFPVASGPGPATLRIVGRDAGGRTNDQVVGLTVR